ncbi:hypothetical protein Emag_007551 [Eimeria magna]
MKPELVPIDPLAELGAAIASPVDLQDASMGGRQSLRRQKARERVVSVALLAAVILAATATAFIITHCASLYVGHGTVFVRRLAEKEVPEICGHAGAMNDEESHESESGSSTVLAGSDEDIPDGADEGTIPFTRIGTLALAPVFRKKGVRVRGVHPFDKIGNLEARRLLKKIFKHVALGDYPEGEPARRECRFTWGKLEVTVTATTNNTGAVFSTQGLKAMAQDVEKAVRHMYAVVHGDPSKTSYTAEVQSQATNVPTSEPGVVTIVVRGESYVFNLC